MNKSILSKLIFLYLITSLLLIACSNNKQSNNSSTPIEPGNKTASIDDATPTSNPNEIVLDDSDQKDAFAKIEQLVKEMMSFDEEYLLRGAQLLSGESFRSNYINQIDYQLNINDWTKLAGSKDLLPKVKTITLNEIKELNPPNEDYLKKYLINVDVTYDSNRYVLKEFQLMGFTINKKAENSTWEITGFNTNQYLQITYDENGKERWEVIPEPEEQEAVAVAKKAITSFYTFSDRKSANDTKGIEEIWHPSYKEGTIELMKENGTASFDSLTPEQLPEVTHAYVVELLPITEKIEGVDKACISSSKNPQKNRAFFPIIVVGNFYRSFMSACFIR
jgi:hypothetical protein